MLNSHKGKKYNGVTEKKLKDSNVNIKYILLGGGILVGIGISVYIGSKRKYWFW